MSRIAGIDFSTHAIDIVLLNEDTDHAEWTRIQLPSTAGDAFERTRHVRETMPCRGWWLEHVIAIGIEQPRGHHGITPLFRVQGAILACLPAELLVQPWNPAEWRKAVGLQGNATKESVAAWGRDLRGNLRRDETWPQDAYDALCIAHATRDALERQKSRVKPP